MPYSSINDLPTNVTVNLPTHAQEIFKEAFNNAYKEYNGNEDTARKVAWSAVKKKYKKGTDGKWQAKS